MTTFRVRARDSAGVTRMISRTAASRGELLAALRAERLLVLEVAEERTQQGAALPGWWHPGWLRPMTGFEVELGLRQIGSLLRSGIPLLSAVEIIAQESLSLRGRRTWQRVAGRIVRGSGFAEALTAEKGRFGELVIRLAEVGERTGELERAVSRAADQLEARRALRAQVVNALAYPLLAMAMAAGVSAFLVVAVIPKVAEFLRAGGTELPGITQALVDFSDWIAANGPAIGLAALAAIAAWLVVRRNELGHEAEDVIALHIPVTGRILRLSATALFARSMQIMTEAGVTLTDALATAARLPANRRYRRRIHTAHETVLRGGTLEGGLAAAREFTPMLRRMAAVGETSGSLPEAFGEAARFHERILALAVRRFGMLIEPVMIVITALIVGFVYIAFFMAIFAVAGTN